MPEHSDYVDFLFHPMAYSVWWVIGAVLVAILIGAWAAGVFVWTLPVAVLREIPVIRKVTSKVLQVKFARSLTKVQQQHDDGQLTTREAFHEISRIFRLFVTYRTGYAAREMTATDIAKSALRAPALDVIIATYSGQFNAADPAAVPHVVDVARKAVITWI